MSKKHPKYKNAPITEAVAEIRVSPEGDFNSEMYNNYYEVIKKEYPAKKERVLFKGEFTRIPESNTSRITQSQQNHGYKYTSNDQKQIIQVFPYGLSFSRLKPYIDWHHFIESFFYAWKQFQQIFKFIDINRIGVRNINNFMCPINELDEYLNFKPVIMKGEYPFAVLDSMERFHIFFYEQDAQGFINLIINPKTLQSKEEVLDIIYDIDVFANKKIKATKENLLRYLSLLRPLKNDLFESCLTHKARESFNE